MKNIFQKIFLVFSLALAILVFSDFTLACSCFSPSLDVAIEDAANIVILKLQSVEKYPENERSYGYGAIKQSKLTVERVYKGTLKVGDELTFAQGGGGDCIWTFSEQLVDTDFLFFLGESPTKDKVWAGYICSRSGASKRRNADLLYLEKLNRVKGKTRLSGTITQKIESPIDEIKTMFKPLAGSVVKINGKGKKIKLKTDENGVYEIFDLPVGKYKITPEAVNGFKFNDEDKTFTEIEINKGTIEEQDFTYEIDNSIYGELYDTNGKLLENVCLNLVPTRGSKSKFFSERDCTNEDGVFQFEKIPIGTYFIVVNQENKVTANSPFGSFFYPNTSNREEAAEFTVNAGDHFDDLIIYAPKTAEIIVINGILKYSDGKPVAAKWVKFYQTSENPRGKYDDPDSKTQTDDKGHFKLRILKGQKGNLFASFFASQGEYRNCPKLDQIIQATGERNAHIETASVSIDSEIDVFDIALKLPFPSCKKKTKKSIPKL